MYHINTNVRSTVMKSEEILVFPAKEESSSLMTEFYNAIFEGFSRVLSRGARRKVLH